MAKFFQMLNILVNATTPVGLTAIWKAGQMPQIYWENIFAQKKKSHPGEI